MMGTEENRRSFENNRKLTAAAIMFKSVSDAVVFLPAYKLYPLDLGADQLFMSKLDNAKMAPCSQSETLWSGIKQCFTKPQMLSVGLSQFLASSPIAGFVGKSRTDHVVGISNREDFEGKLGDDSEFMVKLNGHLAEPDMTKSKGELAYPNRTGGHRPQLVGGFVGSKTLGSHSDFPLPPWFYQSQYNSLKCLTPENESKAPPGNHPRKEGSGRMVLRGKRRTSQRRFTPVSISPVELSVIVSSSFNRTNMPGDAALRLEPEGSSESGVVSEDSRDVVANSKTKSEPIPVCSNSAIAFILGASSFSTSSDWSEDESGWSSVADNERDCFSDEDFAILLSETTWCVQTPIPSSSPQSPIPVTPGNSRCAGLPSFDNFFNWYPCQEQLDAINRNWLEQFEKFSCLEKLATTDKKVHFPSSPDLVEVHSVPLTNEDRIGPWCQHALDRSRFESRIRQTEDILRPILEKHLQKVKECNADNVEVSIGDKSENII